MVFLELCSIFRVCIYLQLQDLDDSTPSGSVHSKDSDKESADGTLTNGNGFHKNPRDPADVGAGRRVSRSPSCSATRDALSLAFCFRLGLGSLALLCTPNPSEAWGAIPSTVPRRCSDLGWCVTYFAFTAAMAYLVVWVWPLGQPGALLKLADWQGEKCGLGSNKDKPLLSLGRDLQRWVVGWSMLERTNSKGMEMVVSDIRFRFDPCDGTMWHSHFLCFWHQVSRSLSLSLSLTHTHSPTRQSELWRAEFPFVMFIHRDKVPAHTHRQTQIHACNGHMSHSWCLHKWCLILGRYGKINTKDPRSISWFAHVAAASEVLLPSCSWTRPCNGKHNSSSFVLFFSSKCPPPKRIARYFSCIKHFRGLGISAAHEFPIISPRLLLLPELRWIWFHALWQLSTRRPASPCFFLAASAGLQMWYPICVHHCPEGEVVICPKNLNHEPTTTTTTKATTTGGFLPVHPWRKQWWTAPRSPIFINCYEFFARPKEASKHLWGEN